MVHYIRRRHTTVIRHPGRQHNQTTRSRAKTTLKHGAMNYLFRHVTNLFSIFSIPKQCDTEQYACFLPQLHISLKISSYSRKPVTLTVLASGPLSKTLNLTPPELMRNAGEINNHFHLFETLSKFRYPFLLHPSLIISNYQR
jgi:hypothetical protein